MTTAPEPASPDRFLGDRRLLGLLIAGGVMALVVVTVIGFSGAYFSSTSRSPGNEFVAARMGLNLTVTGQIVDGAGMRPGDVRTGDQSVTNTGHRGALVLSAQGLDQTQPLSQVLNIVIRQTDPSATAPVYDGSLADLGSVELGTMEKDERRTYTFKVTWPANEDSPALDGTSTSLTFDWHLESVQ